LQQYHFSGIFYHRLPGLHGFGRLTAGGLNHGCKGLGVVTFNRLTDISPKSV